jgi:hypothetical protein
MKTSQVPQEVPGFFVTEYTRSSEKFWCILGLLYSSLAVVTEYLQIIITTSKKP